MRMHIIYLRSGGFGQSRPRFSSVGARIRVCKSQSSLASQAQSSE